MFSLYDSINLIFPPISCCRMALLGVSKRKHETYVEYWRNNGIIRPPYSMYFEKGGSSVQADNNSRRIVQQKLPGQEMNNSTWNYKFIRQLHNAKQLTNLESFWFHSNSPELLEPGIWIYFINYAGSSFRGFGETLEEAVRQAQYQ